MTDANQLMQEILRMTSDAVHENSHLKEENHAQNLKILSLEKDLSSMNKSLQDSLASIHKEISQILYVIGSHTKQLNEIKSRHLQLHGFISYGKLFWTILVTICSVGATLIAFFSKK